MSRPTISSFAAVAAVLCLFATPTTPGFAAAGSAAARAAAAGSAAPAPAAPDAASAFEKLKALAGTWEAKDTKGNVMPVTYTVIANGSGVMEEIGGEDMVTVYHRDGERLMLTHYCAANNQPRMRLRSASADGKALTFELLDVTNLRKPTDGHMRALVVTFVDPDHFSQQWTFIEAGKDQPEQFTYARLK